MRSSRASPASGCRAAGSGAGRAVLRRCLVHPAGAAPGGRPGQPGDRESGDALRRLNRRADLGLRRPEFQIGKDGRGQLVSHHGLQSQKWRRDDRLGAGDVAAESNPQMAAAAAGRGTGDRGRERAAARQPIEDAQMPRRR